MDLYPCLQSGGTLWTVTKDMINRPKLLFEALKQSNVNVWTSTPSFAQMCLMDPSYSEELLPELSLFMFCGETLPASVARQLKERFPKARVFNTYGPTEATVAVTSIEVTDDVLNKYSSLPVGSEKPETEIVIIDEDGKAVQEGEKGEIIITGASVSKGYLGEKALTEKAFSLTTAPLLIAPVTQGTKKTASCSSSEDSISKSNCMATGLSLKRSNTKSISPDTCSRRSLFHTTARRKSSI